MTFKLSMQEKFLVNFGNYTNLSLKIIILDNVSGTFCRRDRWHKEHLQTFIPVP